jgi:hypothetical protein
MRNRLLLLACLCLLMPTGARAQSAWIDVFWERDPASGHVTIYFLDALSGLSTVVTVDSGQNFTLAGDYVLYEKPQNGAIMRATLGGMVEPHPFIRRTPDLRALRWVVSPDHQGLAWVQVTAEGLSEAYVAWADGRDLRQLPIALPDTSVELAPAALTRGLTDFFYDITPPLDPAALPVYLSYSYLARYSMADETFYPLPEEPNCPCGAGFSADGRIFARLEAQGAEGPFHLRVWDLRSDASTLIPAPDIPYRLAGDLLLNASGTYAVYSVATPASESSAAQYALVLVDVVARQQYLVMPPGPDRFRPLAFIDDDGGLLLADVTQSGTYKFSLLSGDLQQVSSQTYLGTISGS